jgi:phytoene dehydrogenase-like protein
MAAPDAIVIGSGPNGLSAAIALARAGRKVVVYEALDVAGGGTRSAALTLPGFVHDVCSAIHPFAVGSPFLRTLPLEQFGLEWIAPPAQFAHPLDNAGAALVWRSIDDTATELGVDGRPYRALVGRAAEDWPKLESSLLGPPRLPNHPLLAARFGVHALRSAAALANGFFHADPARALLAGAAAHTMVPLDKFPTGAVGLVLTVLAHTAGWQFPRGGAQRLADALVAYLRSLGGEVITGAPVANVDDLPPVRALLCDLSPEPLLRIAGHRFTPSYRARLEGYRHRAAAFKVDWALDAPIPWKDTRVASAATVHLGGTFEEIAASERDTWEGRVTDRPYVLLAQHTLFDPSRAPEGKHTAWAYCHVPCGSTADMLPRIEAQIERFAPGFRDRVLARHVITPAAFEAMNPNLVAGDIGMGAADWRQFFIRPTWRLYGTSARGIYICSAATPPGVGVHGMCGYFAAQAALAGSLRD